VVWAGPFSTLLLGDLGAEVIKVENPFVMQPMTRGTLARPPKEIMKSLAPARGGYPNSDPGPRPWNYNPTFVSLYRNKKSFTVDLRRPEGREILARLIAKTDVVVENNASETLPKLGITYEWLQSIKPDIIMLRVPAYGSEGEYAQARALGVHLESVMGHTLLRGYEDLDPSNNTAIFSGDYLAGAQAALAVMMAAWYRNKTGRGQKIELGQAENASAMLAQSFMSYLLTGEQHSRSGNRSIYGDAPCGVYPCKSPGPVSEAMDRWISINVTSDAEWAALRRVMGDPGWACDSSLATCEGRRRQQDLLDARLAEWTKAFDDYELFHRLQAAGVPAAPVLEGSRSFDDPHVQARGLYQAQTLFDGIGPYRFTAPFYRFPEMPITVRQPAVAMGEHNDYVYREVIGVSEEEYEALKAAGHVSMDFDPSIP
jgi:crotonobetainyl-CoA:carnitine CoA-transferase CaiB-like acyl-CoA transferase